MEYRIRKTSKGQYRVTNQADNELGKFSTEAEAQAFIQGRQAADEQRAQVREQAAATENAYNAGVPALNDAQLTWQEWRSWFYRAMQWSAKDTAAAQRAIDMKADEFSGRPSFERQESHLAESMREDANARELYGRAVDLDTRIKAARRAHDTAALAEALAEVPAMIDEMRPYFQGVGVPPPVHSSGTKPNASIVLTDAELRLIEEHFGGSKSAAIHAALARLASE